MTINTNNKNRKEFTLQTQKVSYTVNKDPIEFSFELLSCKSSGEPCPTEENLKNIHKKAVELYCEKHGLLTSEELIKIRRKLGLKQKEFCDYLNIGIPSLSVWENSVRPITRAADGLIRLKTSPEYLEKHQGEITKLKNASEEDKPKSKQNKNLKFI